MSKPPSNSPTTEALSGICRRYLLAIKEENSIEATEQVNTLCNYVNDLKRSRIESAKAIGGGRIVSAKIKHRPKPPHPPISNPRGFDASFFVAMMLAEAIGWRLTFQWQPGKGPGRYYLRAELKPKPPKGETRAGRRVYIARVIVDAEIGRNAMFDDDHHSYRRTHLIQRAGGSLGVDRQGKHGREQFIKLSRENYEKHHGAGHAALSPDELEELLRQLFAATDRTTEA